MTYFALVDCNNFFVSCERAVDPALQNKPVVVLSNNDGCIVSRSQEAKALGIRMGEPYFKIKGELNRKKVRVISSNFNLYTRKSEQVMQVLAQFTPQLEVYSIDEAFLQLDALSVPVLRELGRDIRQAVLRETRIPVSLGLAETRTRAKLANAIAKKNLRFEGVLNLVHSPHWDMILTRTPVGRVWGVGRNLLKSLSNAGITTARALRDADDRWLLKRFNVTLLRTVLELRGISCISLQRKAMRHSVMYTRSFGQLITQQPQLESAVAGFAAHAGEKLREEGMVAGHMTVYFRTSRHIGTEAMYSACGETRLLTPTACTQDLIQAALTVTRQIFKPGYGYYKAGIILRELAPCEERQMSLFETRDLDRLDRLTRTLDDINRAFGAGTLQYAVEGLEKPWLSRRNNLSEAGLAACLSSQKANHSEPSQHRPMIGFVHPVHG